MSDIQITLPDGSSRAVPAGTRVADVAASISPRLLKAALAGSVDGKLVDLSFPLERDASVRIVTSDSPEALALYRHSTAHLLAAAVTNLFPGVQCGIGPATDEGFFYDFVVPRPFVPEDLEAIEKKMRELAQQDLPYERRKSAWPRPAATSDAGTPGPGRRARASSSRWPRDLRGRTAAARRSRRRSLRRSVDRSRTGPPGRDS